MTEIKTENQEFSKVWDDVLQVTRSRISYALESLDSAEWDLCYELGELIRNDLGRDVDLEIENHRIIVDGKRIGNVFEKSEELLERLLEVES